MDLTAALFNIIAASTPLAVGAHLLRPDALGHENFPATFVTLRAEPFTVSLLRFAWRIFALSLIGSPITLCLYFAILHGSEYPRAVLLTTLAFTPVFGVLIGAFLQPFTWGMLNRDPADQSPPTIRRRLLGWPVLLGFRVLVEGGSRSRVAERIGHANDWAFRRLRADDDVQNTATFWALSVLAYFVLYMAVSVFFVFTLMVYITIAVSYSTVVLLPLLFSREQLESLNEPVFLAAFGLTVLGGTDILVIVKGRFCDLPGPWPSVANWVMLCADVVFIYVIGLEFNVNQDQGPLDDSRAILLGLSMGVWTLVYTDLGQALLSLIIALRATARPPSTGAWAWRKGQNARLAVGRRGTVRQPPPPQGGRPA